MLLGAVLALGGSLGCVHSQSSCLASINEMGTRNLTNFLSGGNFVGPCNQLDMGPMVCVTFFKHDEGMALR